MILVLQVEIKVQRCRMVMVVVYAIFEELVDE
jgi:hypothetical protein